MMMIIKKYHYHPRREGNKLLLYNVYHYNVYEEIITSLRIVLARSRRSDINNRRGI